MSSMYILKGTEIVEEPDITKWARFMDSCSRIVGKTQIDNVLVSTVFLGIPHCGGMFETMIFGGPNEGYQERYETLKLAQEGHIKTVKITLANETIIQ